LTPALFSFKKPISIQVVQRQGSTAAANHTGSSRNHQ
jgi:hypothetical protein